MSLRFGRHARADAADAMARDAAAFALEHRAAARDVAGLDRRRVERVHVAKVGDDAGHLGVVERERRHPRGLRPGPDEAGELVVGDRVPELAAAQVDAADRVALRAVAGHASRRVEARPIRDVDVWILAVVNRRRRLRRLAAGAPIAIDTVASTAIAKALVMEVLPCCARHYPPAVVELSIWDSAWRNYGRNTERDTAGHNRDAEPDGEQPAAEPRFLRRAGLRGRRSLGGEWRRCLASCSKLARPASG